MELVELSERHKRKNQSSEENNLKKLKTDDLEEEKIRLEKLVIGDESSIIRNISQFLNNDSGLEDSGDEDNESTFSDTLDSPQRQPAWIDEDDNFDLTTEEAYAIKGWRCTNLDGNVSQSYQLTLRKKFISIFGEPSWAKLNKLKSSDDDDDDSVLRSCGNFINKSGDLPKSVIDAKRVASLNSQTRNEGPVVKVVEFHPTMSVSLVAGSSGTASILQVDGQINNKLSSVQFERFPIKCGKFTKDGNKFIVGSNIHSHFHVYDMIAGKSLRIPIHHNMELTSMKSFLISPDGSLMAVRGRFGNIHLITTASFEWIGNLKMNNNVTALAFNSTGSTLYSHSDVGEMYAWDMTSRSVLGKWADEGCLQGTCMSVSPDNRLLATGQSSGVVNIYSTSSLSVSVPRVLVPPSPIKTIFNLTTNVSFLSFDSTSQILCFGSDEKDNSIKLCHTPSMTVFSNFPSFNSNLRRIQCASFSPNSGFLSFANNNSTAYLYRLKHFGNY